MSQLHVDLNLCHLDTLKGESSIKLNFVDVKFSCIVNKNAHTNEGHSHLNHDSLKRNLE